MSAVPAAFPGARSPPARASRASSPPRGRCVARAQRARSSDPTASARPSPSSPELRLAALGVAAGALLGAATHARPALALAPPSTPDASTSPYIQSLLAKTEANREVRAVELANKNCLRQSQMGVGDCAGLPEDELRAAMARSVEKLEARRAREAAEEAELAAQVRALDEAEASGSEAPDAEATTPEEDVVFAD